MNHERVLPWAVLGAGVVAYNLGASDGNTLSEIADIAIEKHPIATRLAIGAIALHVANLVPERWDGIHQAFKLVRRES